VGLRNGLPSRANFIERVCRSPDRRTVRRAPTQRSEGAYYRWIEMLKTDPTRGGLVPVPVRHRTGRFHTAHKLTLMALSCLFGGAGSPKH
jgi:hypothetical protein